MSLANMNKDVITRLMSMISPLDDISEIKRDHSAYAKLSLLASQMQILQHQALHIVSESQMNARLQEQLPREVW